MPKTSILQDINSVRSAVEQSSSMWEALNILGLRPAGGNYKGLHEACKRFGIPVKRASPKVKHPMVPDENVFCADSNYSNRRNIKKRLLARGLPQECAICKLAPFWNNKPLTLQLDHINGIFDDNRPENLRLLCPNCHSQTDTFAGRNKTDTFAGRNNRTPGLPVTPSRNKITSLHKHLCAAAATAVHEFEGKCPVNSATIIPMIITQRIILMISFRFISADLSDPEPDNRIELMSFPYKGIAAAIELIRHNSCSR